MTADQEDQELVMALLQCEDDWQRADMLELFGHHDKADALRDRWAAERAKDFYDEFSGRFPFSYIVNLPETVNRRTHHITNALNALLKEKALGKPAP